MENKRQLLLCLLIILMNGISIAQDAGLEADLVVAADGSGDFTSIGAALDACRVLQDTSTIIYIKNGIYREKVHVDSFLTHIRLVGESTEKTIISYGDYAKLNNMGTFRTYTLKISGNDISLENLTIENTAGFDAGQAVALHVEGDHFRAINCRITGNQDTLYANGDNSRQYYKTCLIEGTTDFIFGSATAVFEECFIHSMKNSYITASRTPEGTEFGYVFLNCDLTAAPGIDKVYLGRPWRDFARVVYLHCQMGDHIVPQGWHNWSKPEREKTAYYAEYQCTGPGSDTSQRVSWSHQLTEQQASNYTTEQIFSHCITWKLPSLQ